MAKTILCVDDSVTMQKVAEITFDASDFSYHGARNADEGLAAARANKPDLILADAVMPGKTGYDLCQAIKDDPSLADVPVLIMCGNSQAYDTARGTGVGADGHVVKPWDTQVMLDKVTEVLENGAAKPSQPGTPVAVPAASSTPLQRPPTPPVAAAPPAPPPRPAIPPIKQPEPPRSATIMGMPSIKLPGEPAADFGAATPVAPKPPGPPSPPPAMKPPPSLKPTPPPLAPPMPISMPAPTPIKPPAPFKPRAPIAAPTPPAAKAPEAPKLPEMPRPPMIKGTPRRRPASITALGGGSAAVAMESAVPEPVPAPPLSAPTPPPLSAPDLAPAIAARTSAAAADVAQSAGLDPNGPEMAALTKLSREVVERVVWEVVPDLAEAIIREHIAKNGLN